jgi:hypothetical protein
LETGRVQQVILKQLAGMVGFGKGLHRKIGVIPARDLRESCLELVRQVLDVSPVEHRFHVVFRVWIGVTVRFVRVGEVRQSER